MKLNKSQRSNLILFIIIVVLIFTPLGGFVKETTSKVKAYISTVDMVDNRVAISNYNWKLKGVNTENIDFNSTKGKVVLVNFWATWCPPCRAEMRSLQKLYDDYKDQVVFIFATNEKATTVNKYLDKKSYSLPSYNQRSKQPNEFKVSSIPATYIINKNGEIVVHEVGPMNWNSDDVRGLLDDLLK